MRRGAVVAVIMVLMGVLPLGRAASAPPANPQNDYGVLSEEVVKQRVRLVGHTQIVRLTKTATGYVAITIKDGRQHTLVIDGANGFIKENGVKLQLPAR